MSATGLSYEVLVTEPIPLALSGRLPDGGSRTWAPVATTLVQGRSETIVVDPPLTTTQVEAVADRVRAGGRGMELQHAMVRRYPDHLNRSSLWGSGQALYAART